MNRVPATSFGLLHCCLLTVAGCSTFSAAFALENIDFESQIRPILREHCHACHGARSQQGSLRIDGRSFALRGSGSGPVWKTGDSQHSLLFQRISSEDPDVRMPPKGPPLTAQEIKRIRLWIDQGAVWPETEEDRALDRDPRLTHWAWQPVVRRLPPDPSATDSSADSGVDQAENAVDQWILAGIREHGGDGFSEEAERRQLIRRLSYDLLGMPPTPEAVQEFEQDADPQAWERLVDRTLASPHYGERMARHWLDLAHYADTHGFERDQRRDHAWRYRDWVIRAFNSDLPWDQFLQDQIAGDVLRPDDPNAVVATGFLAAGPWDFVGQAETPSPVLRRLARADDLDDMVTQVMTAACAITINCARCHDHKLDPITQREYYSLWSVFAGVRRGDRIVSGAELQRLNAEQDRLTNARNEIRTRLAALRRDGIRLSDIVGGGDGSGSGTVGVGIDPVTGQPQQAGRGFLEGIRTQSFVPSSVKFVDGVFVPDGSRQSTLIVSSTGLTADGIPATSGKAWDAVRNGPIHSGFSTTLGGIDFASAGHHLLSLHANAGITFDLREIRAHHAVNRLRLQGAVGYFGQTPRRGASASIWFDGKRQQEFRDIGREDGLLDISLPVPVDVRFLTLIATDSGNDIGHDQIGFADTVLVSDQDRPSEQDQREIDALTRRIDVLERELSSLPEAARVYAVVAEEPSEVRVHLRGNPEQTGEIALPGAVECVTGLSAQFGGPELSDGQRRTMLAQWITSPDNPLTRRVIVNRLWQYHFGTGLVDTPSDFGLGGSLPTHPELLDWLADEFLRSGWSVKQMHRTICLSRTYRQVSSVRRHAAKDVEQAVGQSPDHSGSAGDEAEFWNSELHRVDSSGRLLWRQTARRVDAESLRDSILTVSGSLNTAMFGPGFRDFEYQEEYAPIYTYVTADRPDLWRRSIYRFTVRTTPDRFMTTLDCPSASNLTPVRNMTTTALQSLALLNNDFMLKQAGHFAERLRLEFPDSATQQVRRAFALCFGRQPEVIEQEAAEDLVDAAGLEEFCRMLFNTNEFIYVD